MMKIPPIVSHKLECMGLLCAFLIVAIHVPGIYSASNGISLFVKQFFSNGLCRIAVPYFFISSGYLLGQSAKREGWYFAAIKKRCKSLLLPYLIWSLMWACFSCFMSFLSCRFKHGQFDWVGSFPTVVNILGIDLSRLPRMYILWFLRVLMAFVVVSPALVWLVKNRRRAALSVCISFILLSFSDILPRGIAQDFSTGLLYFILGLVFARQDLHAIKSGICATVFFISGVLLLACFAANLYSLTCLMHVGILITILGLYSVFPDCVLPTFARGCSFPIYLIHLFVLQPLAMTISAFTGSHDFNDTLVGYFFYWVFGGALSFVLSVMIRKIPNSSILFGGR